MGVFDRKPNFDKLKEKRDIRGLIKALSHKDPWVREIAVKVLRDIGYVIKDDIGATSALVKILKDECPGVRFHAPYALWSITTYGYNSDRDIMVFLQSLRP